MPNKHEISQSSISDASRTNLSQDGHFVRPYNQDFTYNPPRKTERSRLPPRGDSSPPSPQSTDRITEPTRAGQVTTFSNEYVQSHIQQTEQTLNNAQAGSSKVRGRPRTKPNKIYEKYIELGHIQRNPVSAESSGVKTLDTRNLHSAKRNDDEARRTYQNGIHNTNILYHLGQIKYPKIREIIEKTEKESKEYLYESPDRKWAQSISKAIAGEMKDVDNSIAEPWINWQIKQYKEHHKYIIFIREVLSLPENDTTRLLVADTRNALQDHTSSIVKSMIALETDYYHLNQNWLLRQTGSEAEALEKAKNEWKNILNDRLKEIRNNFEKKHHDIQISTLKTSEALNENIQNPFQDTEKNYHIVDTEKNYYIVDSIVKYNPYLIIPNIIEKVPEGIKESNYKQLREIEHIRIQAANTTIKQAIDLVSHTFRLMDITKEDMSDIQARTFFGKLTLHIMEHSYEAINSIGEEVYGKRIADSISPTQKQAMDILKTVITSQWTGIAALIITLYTLTQATSHHQ
jgi:hypothetical protein